MSNNVLISQSDFAKLMGVSKQAVSKAIKDGRITQVIDKNDGKLKLNADMAAAEWRKKTDLRIENSKMSSSFRPQSTNDPDDPADNDDGISKESGGLYKAKTDKERMQAKLLELDYKEKTGELISAETVKKDAFKLGRLTRDAVLNVCAQISNELAAETDPFQVHQKLSIALTKALEDMVQVARKAKSSEIVFDDEVDQEEEELEEDPDEDE